MDIDRILVTGGSGLLGRSLAPLLADAYAVTHFGLEDPGDGLPFTMGDLRDSGAVEKACQDVDAVIHAAALHGRAWEQAGDDVGFGVNVIGTKNVLEYASLAGVKRIVFTSSIWATGHGSDPPYLPIDEDLPRQPFELYGLTKLLGEQMCRYASERHGVSTIALRPGGIRPAEAHTANQVGYLVGAVDVRDVALAHLLAVEAPEDIQHDVFVIASDTPLCRVAPDAFKRDPIAALEDVVPGAADLAADGRLDVSPSWEWYTIEKAKAVLGYRPRYGFEIEE
ncbi:MAG: NAD(P)-dependent oxidoreductase [Candidatus Latescibacteria bacterium]|jgi:nucleoside-diphosphate-sugar epimerase|nr:NAD(P)-dependent oxidoreductase [Candidatus Latescibacterota bacterium]